MVQTINSGFIGNFKVGDNIAYNLEILGLLYACYNQQESEEKKSLLRKPIIVTAVSVIEAIIYDFRFKAKSFTAEGLNGLTDLVVEDVKSGKKDQFDKLVTLVRNNDIFLLGPKFYDVLDDLRKLRNRVHIQNDKNHFAKDEEDAFSEQKMKDSEFMIEMVIRFMTINFNRGKPRNHVRDFILPWAQLLKDTDIPVMQKK